MDRDGSSELKEKDQDAFGVTEYFPLADQGSILITTRLSKLRQHEMGPKGHHLLEVNEQQALQILNNCLERPPEGQS